MLSLSGNMAQGFYLCNVVPRVLRIFSYAMLSGASRTTLHKVFHVQCCPRRYSWDNISQVQTLCSVVLISLGKHCTDKNSMQHCLWDSIQQCTGKILILLRQHWKGQNQAYPPPFPPPPTHTHARTSLP